MSIYKLMNRIRKEEKERAERREREKREKRRENKKREEDRSLVLLFSGGRLYYISSRSV